MTERQQYPKSKSLRPRMPVHVWPALASMLTVGVMAFIWNALVTEGRALIRQTTVATARNVQSLVRHDLDGRITVLSGLAQRWHVEGADRVQWAADVKNIYDAYPGFQRIVWIDPSLHIRWVEPIENNQSVVGVDLKPRWDATSIVETARDTGAPVVSAPIDLLEGDRGMLVTVPIYRGDRFQGVVTGVLRLNAWLATLSQTAVTTDYKIAISIDDQAVYRQREFATAAGRTWTAGISFDLHNRSWYVAATPSASYISLVHSRFSGTMLSAAIVLGVLIYVAVFAGITSRRRARQVLSTSRQLEGLLMNLPGMSYRLSAPEPWSVIYASEGSKALCGYDREDLEQQRVRWDELIHPDDLGSTHEALCRAFNDRNPHEAEYRIRTRSGSERWVWDRGTVIESASGKNLVLEGFITDITDRQLAEFRLRAAQSYSEAIVDAAVEAVITMGADDQIRSFNREAEEIFGFTVEEVVGRSFRAMLPATYHEEHSEYIRYFNESGKLKYKFRRREMRLLRKDGTEFPAHVSTHEILHQEEQQFVVTVRDVSLEQAAEAEAREHREHLAHVARLNMLGEMASGIAHEVNQPLTAISLFSQAGKRLLETGRQEQVADVFDKLSQHAQRAGAVIERMQTMTRQTVSRQETVDCNRMLRDVVTLAEADARIQDIQIDTKLDEKLPPVNVDTVQIQQVVLNLLRNGMEAMRSDGCRRGNTIELRARRGGPNLIEIVVMDRGGGISGEREKDLFTSFSTTKESGMGMGLSISQSIVAAHGGHITFENNSAGGATFSFTLPAVGPGVEDE